VAGDETTHCLSQKRVGSGTNEVRGTRSWQHSLEIKILQGAGRSSRLIGLIRTIMLVPRESQRITVTAQSLDSYLTSRFRVPQPYSAAWPATLPLEPVYRTLTRAIIGLAFLTLRGRSRRFRVWQDL
jgi:hypothetical protein